MENKMKFQKGQRVWSSKHGWGFVVDITIQNCLRCIQFVADKNLAISIFQLDGKCDEKDLIPTLFHKEQEYDFTEPEIPHGTLGYFWEDCWKHRAIIGYYEGLTNLKHKIKGGTCYDNFSAHPELPPHLKENP